MCCYQLYIQLRCTPIKIRLERLYLARGFLTVIELLINYYKSDKDGEGSTHDEIPDGKNVFVGLCEGHNEMTFAGFAIY